MKLFTELQKEVRSLFSTQLNSKSISNVSIGTTGAAADKAKTTDGVTTLFVGRRDLNH